MNYLKIKPFLVLTLLILTISCKDDKYYVADPGKGFEINKINRHSATQKEKVFINWIRKNYKKLKWNNPTFNKQINADILNTSLDLGSDFLLINQKPAGNFNYEYDFVTKTFASGDNQVRQAGALWGISLIYAYNQDPELRKALDKSLKFFFEYTREGYIEGSNAIFYKDEISCKTGTVALVSLAIIEYLKTEKAGHIKLKKSYRQKLESYLHGYIQHLLSIQLPNAHFADSFISNGKRKHLSNRHNPYADGEVLLAFVKAAKYLGYEQLKPVFRDSSLLIAKHYTMDQWPRDPDSNLTKGFYQWSSMAFWEYHDAGWEDSEYYGDYVVNMAWWMIYTHRTLQRTRNTAYAYEGIIYAYQIAKSRGFDTASSTLAYTIDKGLSKLTSWQVGGPLENRYLRSFAEFPAVAVGGIMNHRKEPLLRIDVTQHQMHAVILALKYSY